MNLAVSADDAKCIFPYSKFKLLVPVSSRLHSLCANGAALATVRRLYEISTNFTVTCASDEVIAAAIIIFGNILLR